MTPAGTALATWAAVPLARAAELDEAEWNGLARRGFHLHAWFRAAEESGWRACHVAVREDGVARAVFPAYLTGASTPHDLHERWLGPLRGLERIGLGLRPVISVQSPFSLTSDPLGPVAALPRPVLDQVFDLLEESAARERARAVVWPFVDPADEPLIGLARQRGYAVVSAGATARLRIWWSSFDEYVASRSKSVRRTIRADLAALASAGVETWSTSDYEPRVAEMDALYRDAYRRRNGCGPRLEPGYFRRLASSAHTGIVAQLASRRGRLVGTSINLAGGQVLDGTFGAFGNEEHGGPTYLNDLVYEPIRLACARGIETIDLGMSALYPKVLRGARLRHRVALVRGSGHATHRVLAALGAAVAKRQEAKERRMLGALWGPRCYEDQEDLP
ncbi:MAG TPA: GNAT family N-acetyltransferase [Gemmatimonadales bacterium]|nr:GNAT family N-acetyltransferase [Gemmatimonadales bacterium]